MYLDLGTQTRNLKLQFIQIWFFDLQTPPPHSVGEKIILNTVYRLNMGYMGSTIYTWTNLMDKLRKQFKLEIFAMICG